MGLFRSALVVLLIQAHCYMVLGIYEFEVRLFHLGCALIVAWTWGEKEGGKRNLIFLFEGLIVSVSFLQHVGMQYGTIFAGVPSDFHPFLIDVSSILTKIGK